MIITLTPNPAVDETSWVESLEPGRVHRVLESQIDPAGKGINVSRMVHRLGWPTIAFGFLAGETGNIVEKALDAERVYHRFVRVPGQTRMNVTVVERDARATSFYGPGPAIPPDAAAELELLIRFWLQGGRVLVMAGSLSPGLPEDYYASYVRVARDHGVIVVLDASSSALRSGLAGRPDLIKPNISEAEGLLGRKLPDEAAVIDGARQLARLCGAVVISMGGQGAVCAQGDRAWRVRSLKIERKTNVGPGDAMVAGLAVALARGDDIEAGLRLGTAAGAATAMTPGTSLGTAADVAALLPRVQIDPVG